MVKCVVVFRHVDTMEQIRAVIGVDKIARTNNLDFVTRNKRYHMISLLSLSIYSICLYPSPLSFKSVTSAQDDESECLWQGVYRLSLTHMASIASIPYRASQTKRWVLESLSLRSQSGLIDYLPTLYVARVVWEGG